MSGGKERAHDGNEAEREFPCSADGCDSSTREDQLIRGSFCSLDCFHRTKGLAALRKIRYDHRFCSSCFRVRKEIDYPPESFIAARSKLVGESMIGEEELTAQMNVESGLVYCACGTIDHDAEDETLRNLEESDSAENIWALLQQLSEESQIADRPSKQPFVDALDRTGDIALAVGASIYD